MNKNKTISFRVTEEEYKIINALAKEHGYSTTNYIVHQSMKNNSCHSNDLSIIPDIRTLLSKLEHKVLNRKKFIKELRKILNGR